MLAGAAMAGAAREERGTGPAGRGGPPAVPASVCRGPALLAPPRSCAAARRPARSARREGAARRSGAGLTRPAPLRITCPPPLGAAPAPAAAAAAAARRGRAPQRAAHGERHAAHGERHAAPGSGRPCRMAALRAAAGVVGAAVAARRRAALHARAAGRRRGRRRGGRRRIWQRWRGGLCGRARRSARRRGGGARRAVLARRHRDSADMAHRGHQLARDAPAAPRTQAPATHAVYRPLGSPTCARACAHRPCAHAAAAPPPPHRFGWRSTSRATSGAARTCLLRCGTRLRCAA